MALINWLASVLYTDRYKQMDRMATEGAAIALLLLLRFGGTELTATEDPFLAEMRQTATEMAELQTYYLQQMLRYPARYHKAAV